MSIALRDAQKIITISDHATKIIEHDDAHGDQTYKIGNNAVVAILHNQKHAGNYKIRLIVDASSSVSYVHAFAGISVNLELQIDLMGQGSRVVMHGMYHALSSNAVTISTHQNHYASDTQSTVVYKSLLSDHAQSRYHGTIVVHKNARGSHAEQSHRALHASQEARSIAIPSLEIHTNEVQCKHGSATGPFDDEQMYYLMSRGLDEMAARTLLRIAFFSDFKHTHAAQKSFFDQWISENIQEMR